MSFFRHRVANVNYQRITYLQSMQIKNRFSTSFRSFEFQKIQVDKSIFMEESSLLAPFLTFRVNISQYLTGACILMSLYEL